MTRERAKQLLPIIQAYAEGKKIQFCDAANCWLVVDEPSFADKYDYRIEPEPPKPREWYLVYDGHHSVKVTDILSENAKLMTVIKVREVRE